MKGPESPEGLLDALMSGDMDYLQNSIARSTVIEGEPLDVLARLLEGNAKYRASCRKKFITKPWPRKSPPPTDPPIVPEALKAALAQADLKQLGMAIRKLSSLEGSAVDVLQRLFAGDPEMRSVCPKRIVFGAWGPGRPPSNDVLVRAEKTAICRRIEVRLAAGELLKQVVADLMDEKQMSRSSILDIWSRWQDKKRRAAQ